MRPSKRAYYTRERKLPTLSILVRKFGLRCICAACASCVGAGLDPVMALQQTVSSGAALNQSGEKSAHQGSRAALAS
jgi:hypothetical protein